MITMRLAVCALALVATAGCYRLSNPPVLGESVRVIVKVNDARLVRAQAYMQNSVARVLQNRLGWKVSPSGSARLELTLEEETIRGTGTDRQNIPVRFNITMHGDAILISRHPAITHTYNGVGHASGLSGEPEALEQAAENAALSLANWLENAGRDWK
jgi:hypothetical protein